MTIVSLVIPMLRVFKITGHPRGFADALMDLEATEKIAKVIVQYKFL